MYADRRSKKIARPWVVRIWYRTEGGDVVSVDSDYLTEPEASALEAEQRDHALYAKAFPVGQSEAVAASEPEDDLQFEYKRGKWTAERRKSLWSARWTQRLSPSLKAEIKGARHLTLPHQVENAMERVR